MFNDTFGRKLKERFPKWDDSILDNQDFNKFRDDISLFYDQINFDPAKMTENLTIVRWFDIRPASELFIRWFRCASTWNDSMDCSNLTRIDSVSNRICTTLMHRGAMIYDRENNPELFDRGYETYVDDALHWNYFDPKEVAKLVLDFAPEDYADLRRQIGARIIFHDDSHVASSGELDFFLTRGFRYDFNIDRKEARLPSEPYAECLDYHERNSERYKDRVEPRVPLGEDTCFQNCIVKNVLYHSNCWPLSMPYYRNDSFDPHGTAKSCEWFESPQHFSLMRELVRLDEAKANRTTKKQPTSTLSTPPRDSGRESTTFKMGTYHKIRRFCWEQCTLSCRITEYTVTMTRSVWPSDVKILFDSTGKERRRRHCCALVTMKFTHSHQSVHEYKPKFNPSDTIGDLGGLLAVWLGISIVSIYKGLQKLIGLCSSRSRIEHLQGKI